jgi:Protein of unknown function (DUF1822)
MTYYTNQLEFEALPIEAIALEPTHIERAIQISSLIPNETRQWQSYLNALALFGFQQWLSDRAANLALNSENCTALLPQYANVFETVCNLTVGEFKLCLIATGSLTDEEVSIARAAIELPEFMAHFYVLIEVQEESGQVIIQGFLRRDRLLQQSASVRLQPDPDWNYNLPLAWFESDPDRLLLYLRCLKPAAIPLPEVPRDRIATLSRIQAELATQLPRLQSADLSLQQVLTWEQAAVVLTHPELLDWIYNLPKSAENSEPNYLSDLLNLLTQQAINVAHWLQDQIDELTQGYSWVLMPAFVPVTEGLRSARTIEEDLSTEEFQGILRQLANTGVEIPATARGAYQDLRLAEIQARLYALTWPFLSPENTAEWMLLLVLGPQFGNTLPHGVRLRVSDQSGILVQRMLNRNSLDTYLYVLIAGRWDEKFLATITLSNGVALTLPPFAFMP